ncbi:MAG TPA: hypothetical protein DIC34_00330 [Treponema sp.]|nr:hypothetical protein [Treponema sp.]
MGSPSNIKQDSASLSNFTLPDVKALIAQHTGDEGQLFNGEAARAVYDLTRGQPWFANALLQKCVWQLCPRGEAVKIGQVREAKEMLIQERAVHLDSLAERLRDGRVKKIVQSTLIGESDPNLAEGDDFRLTLDLGLVGIENGIIDIANPIYRETVARILSFGMQMAIPAPEFRWKKDDGTMDLDALLREFQDFWAQHSGIWEIKADYMEAFPHLLLMAFLQRVANGGGRIEREYAAGRGRVDIAIQYGGTWSIIEIKLVSRAGRERTVVQGLGRTPGLGRRGCPGREGHRGGRIA